MLARISRQIARLNGDFVGASDVNGDGTTNGDDLAIVLSGWTG